MSPQINMHIIKFCREILTLKYKISGIKGGGGGDCHYLSLHGSDIGALVRSFHGPVNRIVDREDRPDRLCRSYSFYDRTKPMTCQDRTSLNSPILVGPFGLEFYNGPFFGACWTN